MILILAIVFFLLILLIGGERGAVSFLSLCSNAVVLIGVVLLMTAGISPILLTAVGTVLIHGITLIYQNGRNKKMFAAMCSSGIVITILFGVVWILSNQMHLAGINEVLLQGDFAVYYSFQLHINMQQVAVCMIIIGLLGAVMDTSVAVTSALYEVHLHRLDLSKRELFFSGISIGKDILATTLNTLYFAYVGESLMLFLYLKKYHYSLVEVINSKAFLEDFSCIIISAIGCMLIIPISAAVSARMFSEEEDVEITEKKKKLRKEIAAISRQLSKEYRLKADAEITKTIIHLSEYRKAKTIFCFVSMPGEIDTTQILLDALSQGKKVGVPKCIEKGIMKVYEIQSLDELEEMGMYHIREPKGKTGEENPGENGCIDPKEIEFAVVPCVSCSNDGRRLGHGGGFYDRYLEKTNAYKAVVCRSKEQSQDIPIGPYDLEMDLVITEES